MTRIYPLYLAAACVTGLISTAIGSSADWDYKDHGPPHWDKNFKKFCAGEKQSPINLDRLQSVENKQLKQMTMSNSSSASTITLTLKNDGHKLELSWSPAELTFQMGPSCSQMTHTAAQLHWHWGSSSDHGSEHTMDNKGYAAEGHLVFYNEADYYNLSNAVNKPYGLAVLGTFYELSPSDNELFKLLEPALENITESSRKTQLTLKNGFDIFKLFLPKNTFDYFRYEGSLTTPPCYESVLWTVFRQPVPISQGQLDLLRRLKYTDNSTMVNNFRPPLVLNPGNRLATPRTVYRTFDISAPLVASALPKLPLAALATVAVLAKLATDL